MPTTCFPHRSTKKRHSPLIQRATSADRGIIGLASRHSGDPDRILYFIMMIIVSWRGVQAVQRGYTKRWPTPRFRDPYKAIIRRIRCFFSGVLHIHKPCQSFSVKLKYQ
jgi:hypothetical protein